MRCVILSIAFLESEQAGNVSKLIALNTYKLDKALDSDSQK